MVKCAQLLDENVDFDFMDINMGCPIDLIYKQVIITIIIVIYMITIVIIISCSFYFIYLFYCGEYLDQVWAVWTCTAGQCSSIFIFYDSVWSLILCSSFTI